MTPVVTEEKVFLPSADQLREAEMAAALEVEEEQEGGAAGLRGLLRGEEREQRSSSEEWEKVDGQDSEC